MEVPSIRDTVASMRSLHCSQDLRQYTVICITYASRNSFSRSDADSKLLLKINIVEYMSFLRIAIVQYETLMWMVKAQYVSSLSVMTMSIPPVCLVLTRHKWALQGLDKDLLGLKLGPESLQGLQS